MRTLKPKNAKNFATRLSERRSCWLVQIPPVQGRLGGVDAMLCCAGALFWVEVKTFGMARLAEAIGLDGGNSCFGHRRGHPSSIVQLVDVRPRCGLLEGIRGQEVVPLYPILNGLLGHEKERREERRRECDDKLEEMRQVGEVPTRAPLPTPAVIA